MTATESLSNQSPRRGRPFAKGNSGRKLGSKNKATQISAQLLDGERDELIRTALDLAKGGNTDMLKFLLNRILPKQRTVKVELPVLRETHDIIHALTNVTTAVTDGQISPDEGASLASMIEATGRTLSNHEIEEKLNHWEAEILGAKAKLVQLNSTAGTGSTS
jgi:hypothetical protein